MPTTKLAKNPNYTKKSKGAFIQSKAGSDRFWRDKLMQVLEVFHDAELHWHANLWHDYGISDAEKRVIEKEFEKQQKWRARREAEIRGRNPSV